MADTVHSRRFVAWIKLLVRQMRPFRRRYMAGYVLFGRSSETYLYYFFKRSRSTDLFAMYHAHAGGALEINCSHHQDCTSGT